MLKKLLAAQKGVDMERCPPPKYATHGRSRNLEFTIVDSCLAQTKSHSQINSLALTVAMCRHWSREPITKLSGPSISMFRVIRTDYHAGRLFIPHRILDKRRFPLAAGVTEKTKQHRCGTARPAWYDNPYGVVIRPAPPTFVTRTECHITYLQS